MTELWDVYDVNRNRTGKIIPRPESWGQEAYHLIVHVGIFDKEGRMLIQRRSSRKHAWADLWEISAGGSALAGEESWRAAERETFEEIGIKLDLRSIRPHFTVNYERGFDDFYAVIIDQIDLRTLTLQESEVEEVRMATQEEVHQMMNDGKFVPYFSGVVDLLWQTYNNYDGAISQHPVKE